MSARSFCKVRSALALFLAFLAVVGCLPPAGSIGDPPGESGSDDTTGPGGSGDPVPNEPGAQALPDFALLDVNPQSARSLEDVSPRDYLGQVSAWYFGHST